MTRNEFIDKINGPAIKACEGTGLFASLMIAQAIVESGDGESKLCTEANNYFGIKATADWSGKAIIMNTREVIMGKEVIIPARFRKYDSLEEGFKDRNKFLKENSRYYNAGVFNAATPEDQAIAFQKAGYATDPHYASLLIAVVNGSGHLKQYDHAI